MYTEDDTYNRLRRPSIAEMTAMYPYRARPTNSTLDNLEFCKLHDWGWEEFLHERYKYQERRNSS